MGVQIDHARLNKNTSEIVTADQYNKSVHGEVLCPDKKCSCPLSHVPLASRNIQNKKNGTTRQVTVHSFFRLPRSSKKTGKNHTHRCRFHGDPVLEKHVGISQEIKKLGKDIEPLLSSGGKKVAEYRLHILMEIIRASFTKFSSDIDGKGEINSNKFSGYKYVSSKKLLKPYIRSAKAILSFISRIGDRNELSRMISLRYGGNSIQWSDFFFRSDEHETLYRSLSNHNQSIYDPGAHRPMAVVT